MFQGAAITHFAKLIWLTRWVFQMTKKGNTHGTQII